MTAVIVIGLCFALVVIVFYLTRRVSDLEKEVEELHRRSEVIELP